MKNLQRALFNYFENLDWDYKIVPEDSSLIILDDNGAPLVAVETLIDVRHTFVNKLGIHFNNKISECWIISPQNKYVMLFNLNDNGDDYNEPMIYTKNDAVKSKVLMGLEIPLEQIFQQ